MFAKWRVLPTLAAVLLVAAPTGCKRPAARRPPPQLRVISLKVLDGTPEGGPGSGVASDAEIAAAATSGLKDAGLPVALSAPPRPHGDFQVRLELRLEYVAGSADTGGRSLLRAVAQGRALEVKAPPGDKAPAEQELEITRLGQDVLAEKVFEGRAPARADFAAHLLRAAKDTAQALGAQLALLSADDHRLLAAARSKDTDPDLRAVAIQLCGQRRVPGAVDALVPLLRDPEMQIRDKAIGALIDNGDRRAVKALAASAPFQDTFELGKILEAVAALGGEEARSYLEFVASGHQSEQIRGEAKVALEHLRKRQSPDGGAPDGGVL